METNIFTFFVIPTTRETVVIVVCTTVAVIRKIFCTLSFVPIAFGKHLSGWIRWFLRRVDRRSTAISLFSKPARSRRVIDSRRFSKHLHHSLFLFLRPVLSAPMIQSKTNAPVTNQTSIIAFGQGTGSTIPVSVVPGCGAPPSGGSNPAFIAGFSTGRNTTSSKSSSSAGQKFGTTTRQP